MVRMMDGEITIDRQGRLVMPSHLLEALGVKDGGQISIRLDGPRLILEPAPKYTKERVDEWAKLARDTYAEANTEETGESWKWMSREYVRRKLGLA
jgi:bifunctional DNA-binding transcriptional regulator/antitoxin component of YhaV-PrlF toxin-antitoxin module